MPDSTRKKAGQKRPRGKVRHSGKDRKVHDAARGKKLPALSDLSRELPSADELSQVFSHLETESDRGCALIAGCLLENTLEMAINCELADCGDTHRKKLFVGSDAPIATFASKILLGRSLAIYDQSIEQRLIVVKNIRNAFAHALRVIDFKNATIEAATQGLHPAQMPPEENGLAPARIRYVAFCWTIGQRLFETATQRGGKAMEVGISISNSPLREPPK